MSEEVLVKHCSPTLAGLKTANMFTYKFESLEEERANIRSLNARLTRKGLRVIPLRKHNGATLIYVYRPEKLKKDLKDQTAHRLLRERGYSCESVDRCIVRLMKRLRECESFPHEIGLFLGYPPEDVCGFIENKADGCKCVGCWKVYGDVEKAQALFEKYKRCTRICCSLAAKGCPVDKLAVSC
ncbi:MAG: DUF3793 family protein [Clostridia bacterium]|nr:DUF3793 family protein [Clostridia bacterium]